MPKQLFKQSKVGRAKITAAFLKETRKPADEQLRNIMLKLGKYARTFTPPSLELMSDKMTIQGLWNLLMNKSTAFEFPLNHRDTEELNELYQDQEQLDTMCPETFQNSSGLPDTYDDNGLLIVRDSDELVGTFEEVGKEDAHDHGFCAKIPLSHP